MEYLVQKLILMYLDSEKNQVIVCVHVGGGVKMGEV